MQMSLQNLDLKKINEKASATSTKTPGQLNNSYLQSYNIQQRFQYQQQYDNSQMFMNKCSFSQETEPGDKENISTLQSCHPQ